MSMTMCPRASSPSRRISGRARSTGRDATDGRATAGADGSGLMVAYATPSPAPSYRERARWRELPDTERVEARDVPAHDQGVDVVGPLVRVHRFQIHHVPDDRVLVHDAGRAEDVASQPR